MNGPVTSATVYSVSASPQHSFSKTRQPQLRLLAGLGVEGDSHAGVTVQHRSRVRQNPDQPNLRQIHLIHAELLEELAARGFTVRPGDLGENLMTYGLDLLALPRGTHLRLGAEAVIEITGLRNPCSQIDNFQPGLLRAVLDEDESGNVVRKAGIMGVVLASGTVCPDDEIRVELPPLPHIALERV
ncbi:MOSC domain-containing protein [Deinococcus frigens]|uniref:MOSC domain-containing protein n=1 Tax=Deinococcus frigens TaxID=249403 RepID=UPI00049726E8|nr:MOSC domain-containing protein [Deinococcus frigens]